MELLLVMMLITVTIGNELFEYIFKALGFEEIESLEKNLKDTFNNFR